MNEAVKKQSYHQEKEAVLKNLQSSVDGLSEEEALIRQKQYGYNELEEVKSKSIIGLFLEQFKDFLVIILIIAATISGIVGDYHSTLVIGAVLVMNAVLGTFQQIKANKALNGLKSLTAPTAKVLRDGIVKKISATEVTVGDIVLIEAGDYICADGRIVENASLKVNESALTGESVSIEKRDMIIENDAAIGDQLNMVFSGSYVTYGRGHFVVTSIGMQTEMGKIATLLQSAKEKKTPLQLQLDQFGKNLSLIILAMCGVLFAISVIRGEALLDALMFAIALAVAAIPEALSSIVTIVLAFGTQKMAKEKAIIRKLQAVEGLGSVSIICSDKTGTLTQNKMTVKKYYVDGDVVSCTGGELKNSADKKLMIASLLCNDAMNVSAKDAKDTADTAVGDPTEIALLNFGEQYDYNYAHIRESYPRLSEIPFDSDRKLMSTLHMMDGKKIMLTKGAVDVLLDRTLITSEKKEMIQKVNHEFATAGLRVLAFAMKEIDGNSITLADENQLQFIGLIGMMDPPRVESREAVLACQRAGIKPIMITGDHKITATAIAKEIGILKAEGEAVEGAEIERLTDEELRERVEEVSVYARVSPHHKVRIVQAWQEKGHIVAMTGDGVNDAPALKTAHIGIAMGQTGTEVAKEAADMVLADDCFATIVKAVESGRNIYANIKRAILFLLSGNTAGILMVLYASLMNLPVPFEAVHLLFINLLTDSLPAIALGLEPHLKGVMNEKPRPIHEPILQKNFVKSILVEGIIISLMTFIAFYIGLQSGGIEVARTMAFSTLCLSRLVHGFNCKDDAPVLGTKKLFNNKYLWLAFGAGFLLLNSVLLIPGLEALFEVKALNLKQMGAIYGLSLSNLLIIQVIKYIRQKWRGTLQDGTTSIQ